MLVALEPLPEPDYAFPTVLEHTKTSSPPHCERFFYASRLFDGGVSPIRKDGGPSRFGCSTTPPPSVNTGNQVSKTRSAS